MPIPFIVGAIAAAGAAVVGIGASECAKDTNKRAQSIVDDAQRMYNNAKRSLQRARGNTEQSLLVLGNTKKQVMDTSIKQFLEAYKRIKNIELSNSIGLDEIHNFCLDNQETLQLAEMTSIYQNTFASGAAGAATGAVIALAASGTLPLVTSVMSTAGSALAIGEFGMAASLAGSAVSLGAAMTPLAAIAAPAMLFSGISSSIAADKNLEKANQMYAEAELAVEKMGVSQDLCVAIAKRSDMYNSLLIDLNRMFAYCAALLDGLTKKKMGLFKNKIVDAKQFTQDELKLIAVTRALAGAVKAIIDTPLLTSEGLLSETSEQVYDNTTVALPEFKNEVNDVKSTKYHARAVPYTTKESKRIGLLGKPKKNNNATIKKISNVFKKLFIAIIIIAIIGLVIIMVGAIIHMATNNQASENREIYDDKIKNSDNVELIEDSTVVSDSEQNENSMIVTNCYTAEEMMSYIGTMKDMVLDKQIENSDVIENDYELSKEYSILYDNLSIIEDEIYYEGRNFTEYFDRVSACQIAMYDLFAKTDDIVAKLQEIENHLQGKWIATGITEQNEVVVLDDEEFTSSLIFNADNTYTWDWNGEVTYGTWQYTNECILLDEEYNYYEFFLSYEQLTCFTHEGETLYYDKVE